MAAVVIAPIEVTADFRWDQAPTRADTELYLELTIKPSMPITEGTNRPESIQLDLAETWRPTKLCVGSAIEKLQQLDKEKAEISDALGDKWDVSLAPYTKGKWGIILSEFGETQLAEDWSLTLIVLLETPKKDARDTLTITIDDDVQKEIPFEVTSAPEPKPIVRLWSDPPNTDALERGSQVVLHWQVANIEGVALLHGPRLTPKDSTIMIANNSTGECTVRLLESARYTLTTEQKAPDGSPIAATSVALFMDSRPPAVMFDICPTKVFPAGPFVCRYDAYGITRLDFDHPCLESADYLGSAIDKSKSTYVVKSGPTAENPSWVLGATWILDAKYGAASGARQTGQITVSVATPWQLEDGNLRDLIRSFAAEEAEPVSGLAVGTFLNKNRDSNEIETWRWIAIAKESKLELWAEDNDHHSMKVRADEQEADGSNQWLSDILEGEYLGVGAVEDARDSRVHYLVALRMKAGLAQLIELELPLQEANPARQVLEIPDDRFCRGPVRILSLGRHLFFLANGAARSLSSGANYTEFEPWLSTVASEQWDVVAIASPSANSSGNGWMFALHKSTGTMLRFDVSNGVVGEPRILAGANRRIAHLNVLQDAQWAANPDCNPFPKDKLVEGRVLFGRSASGVEDLRNPITESSSLMVVGGALLARSELRDPELKEIQDRAYDPRLDVWVRCGHPFSHLNEAAEKHFAWLQGRLYCYVNNQLWSIRASASHLGFMTSNFAPIPADKLPTSARSDVKLVIDNDTSYEVIFRCGDIPIRDNDAEMDDQCFRSSAELTIAPKNRNGELKFWRLASLPKTHLRWGLRLGEGYDDDAWLDVWLDENGQIERASVTEIATKRQIDVRRPGTNELLLQTFAIKNSTSYPVTLGGKTIPGGAAKDFLYDSRVATVLNLRLKAPKRMPIDIEINRWNVSSEITRTVQFWHYDADSKTITIRPHTIPIQVVPRDGLLLLPSGLCFRWAVSNANMEDTEFQDMPADGVLNIETLSGSAECTLIFPYLDGDNAGLPAARIEFEYNDGALGEPKCTGERKSWFEVGSGVDLNEQPVLSIGVKPVKLEWVIPFGVAFGPTTGVIDGENWLEAQIAGRMFSGIPDGQPQIDSANLLKFEVEGSMTKPTRWLWTLWPHPQKASSRVTVRKWKGPEYTYDYPFHAPGEKVANPMGHRWVAYHSVVDVDQRVVVHRVECVEFGAFLFVHAVSIDKRKRSAKWPNLVTFRGTDEVAQLMEGKDGEDAYLSFMVVPQLAMDLPGAPRPIVDLQIFRFPGNAPPEQHEGFIRASENIRAGTKLAPAYLYIKYGQPSDILRAITNISAVCDKIENVDEKPWLTRTSVHEEGNAKKMYLVAIRGMWAWRKDYTPK